MTTKKRTWVKLLLDVDMRRGRDVKRFRAGTILHLVETKNGTSDITAEYGGVTWSATVPTSSIGSPA